MSKYSLHSEWLSLIEVSGPFLAEPVLDAVFPQGLALLDSNKKRAVRQAYYELKDSQDEGEAIYHKLHDAWIKYILSDVLEWDEDGTGENLKSAASLGSNFIHTVMGQTAQLKPDYIFSANSSIEAAEILVVQYPAETNLDAALNTDGWIASPSERMVELCRAKDVRLGLITNGEHWMFIDAPLGGITTFASWYSGIWVQEPKTLQAFVNLFELRRFFLPQDSQLPALLDRSVEFQDDVTEALGEQVGRAVEVLIQAFDRADIDRNHTLLSGVKPTELYEAGLTIMMRIVFLLSAEERGLLLLGDERYESNYAITTLRSQLRETSDEILEKRWDAWSRLLALFRAVYGGVDHQTMRLPALGGSLFDPDRFPFLEGRGKGTKWLEAEAKPLPIDNRTVLLLLEAVQIYNGRTLSYRALDVEQIGYVYEGLLERTAVKAKDVTLDLKATKSAKNPWVTLAEIEEAIEADSIPKLFKDRTGSSASRIRNDLAKPAQPAALSKLLIACQNDEALRDKLAPYIHFIRYDTWDYPLIYPKGSFMVAAGMDRRESGTHYTPKSLTEKIVETTLTPLVYNGPAQGFPQNEWKLKSPEDLLDLRICDPAMGSGAFLVQVCRWLSDKLVEAWLSAERDGQVVTIDGKVTSADKADEHASDDLGERLILAKRLVAERCLYGVDMNPLAVELAKLSIWLVTLSKGRPFGFLDHNLKAGDSLLGITSIEQLTTLDMIEPAKASPKLFAHDVDKAVVSALELRKQIRSSPVKDIRDVEIMASLDQQAKTILNIPTIIADSLVGETLASKVKRPDTTSLSILVGQVLSGDERSISELTRRATQKLNSGLPEGKPKRRPFHWPLEFPEIFVDSRQGFDGFVGNPPFLGGRKISSALGDQYSNVIKKLVLGNKKGSINLVLLFFLKAVSLLKVDGRFGLVGTDSICESDSRTVGMKTLFESCVPTDATSSFPWPGKANVRVAVLHITKGKWNGDISLDGQIVPAINTMLLPGNELREPSPLKMNSKFCSDGVKVQGIGFVLGDDEARKLKNQYPESSPFVVRYIVGDNINTDPNQTGNRWVINFWNNEEEVCRQHTILWGILVDRVKDYRDGLTRQVHETSFWKFWDRREEFFNRVRQKERAIVCSKLSKYRNFTFGDPKNIYSEKAKVFDLSSYTCFAILQSCVHQVWADTWGSTTGPTPAYVGTACFDTFAFPNPFISKDGALNPDYVNPTLEILGAELQNIRLMIRDQHNWGLTQTYNAFHDPNNAEFLIEDLRNKHQELDAAVINLYGWLDIDATYEFKKVVTNKGTIAHRFEPSDEASLRFVELILDLNAQYELIEEEGPLI